MFIPPNVNLLKSLRSDRIDYVTLAGEAFDNAFDAGARTVSIFINDDEIVIKDDGVGIDRKRLSSFFTLGEHGAMTTTQLGRFGVGLKSQAINVGNSLGLNSISKDGRVVAFADWRDVLKSNWEIEDPRWFPALKTAASGTTVTITDLRPVRNPAGGWPRRVSTEIAEIFYPAIADGLHIIVNKIPVEKLIEPKMSDIVECQLSLSGGRIAYLRGGILLEPSRLTRVHVAYRHRVIMKGSTLGCRDYGGLNKMFARVQISGPWHFSRFKDDLPDHAEHQELDDAIAEALQPILEKCNSASMSAKVHEISHLINELVPEDLRTTARPRKNKDKDDPGDGPKRRRKQGTTDPDKSDPDGPARTKRPPQNKLLITFDGVTEQDGVGAFIMGRPHRVNLSKEHPYIAKLLEHRDQVVAVHSLLALAFALFEEGRGEVQPELPFEPFGKRIARLMEIQQNTLQTAQAIG